LIHEERNIMPKKPAAKKQTAKKHAAKKHAPKKHAPKKRPAMNPLPTIDICSDESPGPRGQWVLLVNYNPRVVHVKSDPAEIWPFSDPPDDFDVPQAGPGPGSRRARIILAPVGTPCGYDTDGCDDDRGVNPKTVIIS